jgi:hypothetical protein
MPLNAIDRCPLRLAGSCSTHSDMELVDEDPSLVTLLLDYPDTLLPCFDEAAVRVQHELLKEHDPPLPELARVKPNVHVRFVRIPPHDVTKPSLPV